MSKIKLRTKLLLKTITPNGMSMDMTFSKGLSLQGLILNIIRFLTLPDDLESLRNIINERIDTKIKSRDN